MENLAARLPQEHVSVSLYQLLSCRSRKGDPTIRILDAEVQPHAGLMSWKLQEPRTLLGILPIPGFYSSPRLPLGPTSHGLPGQPGRGVPHNCESHRPEAFLHMNLNISQAIGALSGGADSGA